MLSAELEDEDATLLQNIGRRIAHASNFAQLGTNNYDAFGPLPNTPSVKGETTAQNEEAAQAKASSKSGSKAGVQV